MLTGQVIVAQSATQLLCLISFLIVEVGIHNSKGLIFPALVHEKRADRGSSLGGRTAWSSTVTIRGRNIPARFWYDGTFLHNAKEDAAEVALNILKQLPQAPSSQSSHQQGSYSRGYGR